MKLIDLLRMSMSNLLRRKLRTVLTVLGVVIGTASIVVMISIGLGMNKSNMAMIERYGGLTTINVYASDSGGWYRETESSSKKDKVIRLNDTTIEQLREMEHVEFVSPVLEINTVAKQGSYICSYLTVKGMTLDGLNQIGLNPAQGRLPSASDSALTFYYGNSILSNFSTEKGDNSYWMTGEVPDVDLMGKPMFVIFDQDAYWQSKSGSSSGSAGSAGTAGSTGSATVVKAPKKYMINACGVNEGAIDDWSENSYSVFCDIDKLIPFLQRAFRGKVIPGQPSTSSGKPYKEIYYSSAYVKVDDVDNMSDVQTAINGMGLNASSNTEWIQQTQEQSRSLQMALGGIGAVSMIVAAISIANTMTMSIYERTKEIGIFKVLGCGLENIRNMFLIEAGFIGFIGGVVGCILSFIISLTINFFASRSMGADYASLSCITPWLLLVGIGFAVIVGMLAGLFPSMRAMKLSPLAAIKNE